MSRPAPADPPRARPPQPVGPSEWLLPDPHGEEQELLGFGADLRPETLVDAYRRGIFPWPHERVALPWFSPDPRAVILPVPGVHMSRSLHRTLRTSPWETTVDADFEAVVNGCAAARRAGEGTWITDEMAEAYCCLHRLGWAHSVEVWEDDELVGGIYGVRVGACFTGESMFHRRTDASKVALVDLWQRWEEAGGAVLDVQLPTEHLARMGAVEMARERFLTLLESVRERTVRVRVDRLPVTRLATGG
ncbi:MAG TPA: leucyl/phenylalanyl-tRNA--protein transferase [Acidimicrobiales bacterium]|nr:leucyl/phenylalanyl-tRNA--protein transferase [Acidimicrobiales bacterium]